MGLIASGSTESSFTPAPAGTTLAICCQIIDLGRQYSKFYGKVKHKVLIGWELPEEKDEDGKPYLVWNRYTMSLHEKSLLGTHLVAWRGRAFTEDEMEAFDLKNILGKACLLNIAHETVDKRVYARVKAVMALPRGTQVPKPTHPQIVFDIDDPDMDVFGGLSDGLKRTIEQSEEWQARQNASKAATAPIGPIDDVDSDIPF